jgi:predicted site-specific integrase-resolvase
MVSKQFILSPFTLEYLEERFQKIIKEEIHKKNQEDLQEKLFSPEKTCKFFNPPISKVTLHTWAKQGKIKQHRIGGRVYYKYSEILESLKSYKRYGGAGL